MKGSFHPRALLRTMVSTQCSADPDVRGWYRTHGDREFFSQQDPSNDPLRALAEFLAWFTTDDGSHNGFVTPMKLVFEFMGHYGYVLEDDREFLLGVKAMWEGAQANADSIELLLREHGQKKPA